MQKPKLQLKIRNLRKKYPKFLYKKYSYKILDNNLEIFFYFQIEPNICFNPKIIIEKVTKKELKKIGDRELNNLIFHLGLMEIPTYWKSTCSPIIEIQAGCLDREQINWWKKLMTNGMGQFFYENKIDWRPKSFLSIKSRLEAGPLSASDKKLKDRYLLPFAGGRDSIVTLENLKKSASRRKEIALFMVNPTARIIKTAKVSGIKKQIIVRRVIDRKLLELNKKGYLNGHTPFTALLSFLSVLCAVVFDYKNIAFSNEKSANEGNLKYLGKMVNHQWAKSSQFENMFKKYCRKYLVKNINYFSYLRKYGELDISKEFLKYPKYFSSFSSCNAGMRIIKSASAKGSGGTRWCGNCPKCLFIYATLYPFLSKNQLIKIFKKDIFQNKLLLPIMYDLIGQPPRRSEKGSKPFECVGTKKENQQAFRLSLKKALRQAQGKPIPYLLTKIK